MFHYQNSVLHTKLNQLLITKKNLRLQAFSIYLVFQLIAHIAG